MNKCHFMGNLTRDPVLRQVGPKQTSVVNFGIAVSRKYKKSTGATEKEVTFLECEAWDTGAETISKHFKKGDGIIIHCSAKTDEWEKDGVKHSRLKFRVNEFDFPRGGKKREEEAPDEAPAPVVAVSTEGPDDIPF